MLADDHVSGRVTRKPVVPYVRPVVPIAWFLLQFAALRPLLRLPAPAGAIAIGFVWIATALGLRWLVARRGRLRLRVLSTPWPSVALVAVALAVAVLAYPAVDDRRSGGGGSDADDAVLVVLDGIRDGAEDPYATDTYLGNPPATGPGSLVWFAPFGTRSLYPLGLVVAVAAMLGLLRACSGGWAVPSLTAGLVGIAAPFWEGIAQGSDHIPFACSLAVGACLLGGPRAARLGAAGAATAGLVLGTLATTRATYGHVPLLAALALWHRNRTAALALGAAGTATVLALHGALVARIGWNEYTPVQQLLVKSEEDLSNTGRIVVGLGVLLAAVLVAGQLRRLATVRPAPLLLAGVGVPMSAIALAGLHTATDPSTWSAGSYFLATVPLTAVWVAERVAVVTSDP